jgi:hypothetical protein
MNMRNADKFDVEKAKATGKLEEDVMYSWAPPGFNQKHYLFHGKVLHASVKRFVDGSWVLGETSGGKLVFIHKENIYPIALKGPAQTPRKPRRQPKKGTRRETLVPMSEDVKLKVGDKVLLANGAKHKVIEKDDSSIPYLVDVVNPNVVGGTWYIKSGEAAGHPSLWAHIRITHVIRPYQEPAASLFIDNNLVGTVKDFRFSAQEEKCQAQKDFEAGLWVGFVASANSVCPPWAKDVRVEALLEDGSMGCAPGREWNWCHFPPGSIVAYRKAQ